MDGGWKDGWMDDHGGGWMDEWVDGWIMDGWVDRRMNGRVGFYLKPSFPPETFVQINPTHCSPRLSGVPTRKPTCFSFCDRNSAVRTLRQFPDLGHQTRSAFNAHPLGAFWVPI